MTELTPEEILDRARQVAREEYRKADEASYLDALPPLSKVMVALGIGNELDVCIDLSPLTRDPVFQARLLEANRDAVDLSVFDAADGDFGNG